MITYTRIELPEGEELCYTTDEDIQIPDGLNVYDEEKRSWLVGILQERMMARREAQRDH